MTLYDQDWAAEQRKNRLKAMQNQNRMEWVDEQFEGQDKNPLAVWAALVMVVVVVFFSVMLVLHFADIIDGRPAVNLKLAGVSNALHH